MFVLPNEHVKITQKSDIFVFFNLTKREICQFYFLMSKIIHKICKFLIYVFEGVFLKSTYQQVNWLDHILPNIC